MSPRVARALEYSYQAPGECPSRAQFVGDVAVRLKRPAERSGVERVAVNIEAGRHYTASFRLFERGYEPVDRTLVANDCRQAAEALALAVALALEARTPANSLQPATAKDVAGLPPGANQESPPPVPPSDSRSAAEAPTEPPPQTPAAMPPRGAAPPPSRAFPETAPSETSLPEPHPTLRVHTRDLELRARLGIFAGSGYSPAPSFGPTLGAAVAHGPLELWASGFYGLTNTVEDGGLSAQFFVFGVRLEPCYALELSSVISGVGCGNLEYAGVWAKGVDGNGVVNARQDVAPFWAAGAALGPRFRFADWMSFDARVGLQLPLERHRFRFTNTNDNLHEYPGLAVLASGGVGVRF